MMQLLRNKKGMDYAAMMVMVTIITVIYLTIQLYAKLEPFQVAIGESQVALLNAYQAGEDALLYVDQAARYAVYPSLNDLALRGGVRGQACIAFKEGGREISAWAAKGKKLDECLAAVQPYDAFSDLMNGRLTSYLAQYPSAQLPLNNYEIFVQKDTITGIALEPAAVWLQPPPELREFYVWFVKVAEAELQKAAIGEYAFKPSFTVKNIETKLEAYDELARAVVILYQCTNTKSADACLGEFRQQAGSAVERSTADKDFVIVKKANPVKNPYATPADLAPITFALYLPGP